MISSIELPVHSAWSVLVTAAHSNAAAEYGSTQLSAPAGASANGKEGAATLMAGDTESN